MNETVKLIMAAILFLLIVMAAILFLLIVWGGCKMERKLYTECIDNQLYIVKGFLYSRTITNKLDDDGKPIKCYKDNQVINE